MIDVGCRELLPTLRRTVDEGMGVGGEVLHDWAFAGDDRDRALLERAGASLGAAIAGRRTYGAPFKTRLSDHVTPRVQQQGRRRG